MNTIRTLLMVPHTSFVKNVPLFPDLGLGYLATALTKAGYDVSIKSWNIHPSVDMFMRYIKENAFGVIGIKVFTKDVSAANKTIRIIRSVSPETVIVIGGPHPSASEPEQAVEDFPECDFIFRGEAEIGLPLLIGSLKEGVEIPSEDFNMIPGLVWKEDSFTHSNKPILVPDIDSLGIPSWEMMRPEDYKGPKIPGVPKDGYSAPIIVTRGCPSKCMYCAAYKINGKKVRTRSPQIVLHEIELLYHEYNVRHLFFMDTRFVHNMDVVTEICEGLLEKNIHVAWDCVGYDALHSFTKETLELMKRAGCKLINVGVESGSNDVRNRIGKQGTTEEISQKVKMIQDAGIGVRGYFMIGFPGETRKEIEETVNYAFSLPAESVQFEIVYPHPGTELLRFMLNKYKIEKVDWESFDPYNSPFPLSALSSSKLHRTLKKIRRRYRILSTIRRLSVLRR
ncbi:MAG: radical SAM protein [Thermodesulfobacteriota bacterium]|nr:radical SAM protein [Thermodesulfobacteriota bacterium]